MLPDYGIRTSFGISGNIVALFLFLTPIPTFITMWRTKSVQEFKPDPYIAGVLSCSMWVLYAQPCVHYLNHFWLLTISSAGLVLELLYVTLFLVFSNWPKRRRIIIALACEVVFMAVVVAITFEVLHGTKPRSIFVGILSAIFNTLMFDSPLLVMGMVIRTKSVKFMPFYVSLATFLNGVIWLVYATVEFDPYLTIPNAVGALSGAIQVILFAIYYILTKWDDDCKPPEVQISQNTSLSI